MSFILFKDTAWCQFGRMIVIVRHCTIVLKMTGLCHLIYIIKRYEEGLFLIIKYINNQSALEHKGVFIYQKETMTLLVSLHAVSHTALFSLFFLCLTCSNETMSYIFLNWLCHHNNSRFLFLFFSTSNISMTQL